eukprot:CAMPEP_0194377780 /NCGR_PEP_ID=MMETSP0174-20130528/32294_1 /TAXON_ID=216777 /ORGANISM="Proboscia alata, Strain PI-D3" /LENGTH=387 /DNA_ID=CAMNT_0039159369 /DNA_START=290 /DNA_END=1453 /DNA_ORIENTATION=-
MAPMLDKVAPYMKGKMSIGKIDCTTNKKICARYDVRSYPTLKVFRDGDMFEYPGERKADAIITFGEKMSGNAVITVGSYIDAFGPKLAESNVDGVAFIAYDPEAIGANSEDKLQSTTLLQVFNQIARKQQAYASFGFIDSLTEVESGLGKRSFIAKIEKDVPPIFYDDEINSPSFNDFVTKNNRALVTSLSGRNFRSVSQSGPLVIGVINPDDTFTTENFLFNMKEFALNGPSELKSKYAPCSMDGIKWARFLEQFDIGGENLPEVFVLDSKKRLFYQNSSVSDLIGFLEGVENGTISPQQQAPSQSSSPIEQLKYLFTSNMPWSLLGIFAIILLFYAIFSLDDGSMDKATEEYYNAMDIKADANKEESKTKNSCDVKDKDELKKEK